MLSLLRFALGIQSLYYVASGALPILSMSTFEAITGPKTDDWLVRMVALLAIVIGLALAAAAKRRSFAPETIVLSVGSAAAFSLIDIVYATSGRISKIYLADAVVEMVIVACVLYGTVLAKKTV